jgi:hypothetical protein
MATTKSSSPRDKSLGKAASSPLQSATDDLSADEAAEVNRVMYEQDVRKQKAAVESARMRQNMRNRVFSMQHGLMPQLTAKKRFRKGARPLFSFADMKQRGSATNPTEFGADHIRQRLQKEVGSELHSLSPATTWKLVKSRSDAQTAEGGEAAPVNDLVLGRDDLRVGDDIPSENARQILIASTWRSGSSFFGDLLTQYPGSYYSFEPLHATYHKQIYNNVTKGKARDLVGDLFKCQYDDTMLNYLKYENS